MNIVLGNELSTKLEGIRADLCLQRDTANHLVQEIDLVLGINYSQTHTEILQARSARPQRKRMGIIHNALKILGSKGPQSTPDLLAKLAGSGKSVQGKRPIQTLTGVLHKDMKSATPRVTRSKRDRLWRKIEKN